MILDSSGSINSLRINSLHIVRSYS